MIDLGLGDGCRTEDRTVINVRKKEDKQRITI